MAITYFVALAFVRNQDGRLTPGEAQEERPREDAAKIAARRMATRCAGAVAFFRTGDPSSGDFADAVVIGSFSDVPSPDQLLTAD